MAFQLVDDLPDFNDRTLAEYVMACFDVITEDEDAWSDDWDSVLPARSALEFVRERLPQDRAAVLDRADTFWRAHPAAFNRFSRFRHARRDVKTDLSGWVVDAEGNTPEIPRAHWWWWPLEEAS
jgi:hypothetical protein